MSIPCFVVPCAGKTDPNRVGFISDMCKFKRCILKMKLVYGEYHDSVEGWVWDKDWLVILDTPELIKQYTKIAKKVHR